VTFARRTALCLSGLAVGALVGAGGLPAEASGSPGASIPHRIAAARTAPDAAGTAAAPQGVDASLRGAKGTVSVMLELDQAAAATSYAAKLHQGRQAANGAFRSQTQAVQGTQRSVERAFTRTSTRAKLLFATHALYAGVAVTTDASRLAALAKLPGVKAIHPLSPKSVESTTPAFNSDAFVGAPEVWQARQNTGVGIRIGVIDTGVDYTHADFGGAGTAGAYTSALATDDTDPDYPDPAKVSGGYDFAGDDYNATPGSYVPPAPDDNPLDCNGHGSHVAGTVAGYGEATNGSTYAGTYDTTLGSDSMRIEPGVAPGATIVPLKVFGCAKNATTDLVSEALDWAADPNGDGDPSDHLDVVNMSLGSNYTSPQDPDAVAASNAADLGIVVVAAAGNGGDVYDGGGSPGNSPDAIDVAAADSTNTIAAFSARGIRGAGNLKPDLTAPGVAINSVAFGTGNIGFTENGTSMATPHVAGAAALVRTIYPNWTVQQVKAALMDTATGGVQVDVGTGSSTTSQTAPPMRAGSGLLQADQAISTSVLAYSASEPSAVSISFGAVPVTTTTTSVTKMLRVQSMRSVPTSYSIAFMAASMPAGVTITLANHVVALPANSSVDVPVTLTINPAALKLTADPTKTMATNSSWNTWIAEASGWVELAPRDGRGADLRVSVYAAPRRAATMAAASSATVTSATIGTGTLALSGNGFGLGPSSASGTYASLLTATQLQATSAQLPSCASSTATNCLPFADDSAADIRYVGTSSDAPYCNHGTHGIETCVDASNHTYPALLNVAISTWGAWRTPSSFAQFYVWWDINGDGTPDALTLNTRLSLPCSDDPAQECDTDQLVAQTYLPCHQPASQCDLVLSDGSTWNGNSSVDAEPLNGIGGDLDTSPYDSDSIVLPVALNSLERAGWDDTLTPHVHYWVTTSTVDSAAQVTQDGSPLGPIDTVASSTAPLAVTVASPALGAVGDLGLPELNSDRAGATFTLKLRENTAALLFDLPAGTPRLLLIHHDNLNGARAQVVPVKRAPTVTAVLSATSIGTTTKAKVTVTISPSGATGTVSCRDGSKVVATAVVAAGKATCTLPTLAKGTHSISAVYSGDASYAAKTSATLSLKVS
jgi:subtilisin family serine protease